MPKRKAGIEGVHIVRTKRGNNPLRWYIYAWRGGPRIRVQIGGVRPNLTPADATAIAAAYEQAKPVNQKDLRSLVAEYRSDSNPGWKDLAPKTRKLWSDCLDVILMKFGDTPLRFWDRPQMTPLVVKWRDSMMNTPRAADNRISCLKRLLAFGRLRGRVNFNAAEGIPTLYKGGHRAEIIWTDEDFKNFLQVADQPVSDAIRLAAFTGLRRADLVALRWQDIGEVKITLTAQKRSAGKRRLVSIPIIPELHELLDELRTRPRNDGIETVLVTSRGTAWTETGLNSSVHTTRGYAREEIGKDANEHPIYKYHLKYTDDDGKETWKRLHDIRGTFATKLMTLPGDPLTDKLIASVMGWAETQVSEIRRRYVDDTAVVVALGKRMANA